MSFMKPPDRTIKQSIKLLVLKSHFLNDLYYRYKVYTFLKARDGQRAEVPEEDSTVTLKILSEFNNLVEQRGAQFVVFFIPSRREIENVGNYIPYQNQLMDSCDELKIRCVNLAPEFKSTFQRTYYRHGAHWNQNGNRLAADIIYNYLIEDPELQVNY